jgi:serine/threonine protein kinase
LADEAVVYDAPPEVNMAKATGAARSEAPSELRLPTSPKILAMRLGDWIGDQPIALGHLYEVYRIRHHSTGKLAVLKLLRADQGANREALAQHRQELRILNEPPVPGLPRHIQTVTVDHREALVQRHHGYVWGSPTAQAAGLPAMATFLALVETIADLHNAGYVHGALKAEHLLLGDNCITVLGAGHWYRPTLTTRIFARSTKLSDDRHIQQCAAPEVLAGKRPGMASDVFSLGILAHLLVAPQHFAPAKDERPIRRTADLRPPRPDHLPSLHGHALLPAGVGRIIDATLHPAIEDRYRHAGALLEALRARFGVTQAVEQPPS